MQNLLKALAFTFLILSANITRAQLRNDDQSLISQSAVFSHQYTYLGDNSYYFIDTTFNSLKWYHRWNNAQNDIFEYSALGNLGAALNPLSLNNSSSLWNYSSTKAYSQYFSTEKDIPFYQVRSALTEANYWMGYDRGQNFNIYHTQNINENWNFLVRFKRLNALGFYDHSRNKQSNFLANTKYKNDQIGYQLTSYFTTEKLDTEENGGLSDVLEFVNNEQTRRVLLNVNLPNDTRVLRNREFYLDQKIKLNRLFGRGNDTVSDDKSIDEKGFLALGHTFKYNRLSDVYTGDQSSGFYDNYFFTNGIYTDSSSYQSYANYTYLEGQVGRGSNINVKAGIKNLITQYSAREYQFNSNNWGVSGKLSGRIKDLVDINGTLDYIFLGDLDQSLQLQGEGRIKLWKSLKAVGSYRFQLKYPDFYEQFYISNNYIWDNDFAREARSTLKYGLEWGKGNRLQVTNFSSSNFTYYDSIANPAQANDVVRLFRVELKQNFEFWDFLHFDNRIYYQNTTDAEGALPLPEWVTRNALYFEFPLFKRALICLVGGEVKYFSAYNSPSFNPATGEFYTARERNIGNYPLVDVFANFQIKKAMIFVKLEHANQDLLDYSYFAAPKYPFPDRTLRVGISWRFFN